MIPMDLPKVCLQKNFTAPAIKIRDLIPVLAVGNEILCVLGYEISDKVKYTENTKTLYIVSKTDLKK